MERKCYKYPSIKIENLPPGYNREHPSAWAGATNGLPDLQYICEWINGILVSIDAWAAGKPTLKTSVGCMDLWSAADYQLQDLTCSYKYSFICRKEQLEPACPNGWFYAQGSCFSTSMAKKSWDQANETCGQQQAGGTLASFYERNQWDVFQSAFGSVSPSCFCVHISVAKIFIESKTYQLLISIQMGLYSHDNHMAWSARQVAYMARPDAPLTW
ncbi:uncharacterized protein LOC143030243 [Oratosquilla oratoria]|uniref:uncharacterized protein LOC143030243 n=1 Tax=Oratosquilla oratoria TaxID=337810 RepID=UPI003F773840